MTKKLSYVDRFTEIVKIVCNKKPPKKLVLEWLNRESDSLQDWVGEQKNSPWWLQNIGVLDMAEIAAETVIEG